MEIISKSGIAEEDNHRKLRLDASCLKHVLKSAAVKFNAKTGDNEENRRTAKLLWTLISRIIPPVHGPNGKSGIRLMRMLSYLIPEYHDISQSQDSSFICTINVTFDKSDKAVQKVLDLLKSYHLAWRVDGEPKYAFESGKWPVKIQLHSWVLMKIIQNANHSKFLEKDSFMDCLNVLNWSSFTFSASTLYQLVWKQILDNYGDLLTSYSGSLKFLCYFRRVLENLSSGANNFRFLTNFLSNLNLIERGIEKFKTVFGELHEKTMKLKTFHFCLISKDPVLDLEMKWGIWKNQFYPDLKKFVEILKEEFEWDVVRMEEGEIRSNIMRNIWEAKIVDNLRLLNSSLRELQWQGESGNPKLLVNEIYEERQWLKKVKDEFWIADDDLNIIIANMRVVFT